MNSTTKKWKLALIITFTFSLISCASPEASEPIQDDIVGTWKAAQDEELNIYEFRSDGTGLMRDSSGTYYDFVPFTYQFVEEDKIEFSAQEGYSIFVNLSMDTSDQLTWDAEVTGGYHIDFEKVAKCEFDELKDCIVGQWVRYWPGGEFTVFDFYRTGDGAAFVPEFEEATHFSFEVLDDNAILYQVEGGEPARAIVSMPDNYKMVFDFANEDGPITYYRLDAPFGP
ncbi:MAG: hypothetical protein KJ069_26265 [Anaerolineae bacterium]|nr:hypothetical protein [Anaerolineae bacterium]